MSGYNSRTRMIDSLAEELDDICNRMKRPAFNPDFSSDDVQRLRKSTGRGTDHESIGNHSSDQFKNKNAGISFGPRKAKCVVTSPSRSLPPRDRVYLDFDNNNKAAAGTRSQIENADDEPSVCRIDEFPSDYLKTPISPSKANFEHPLKEEKVPNRIYFDCDAKTKNFCSNYGLFPVGKRVDNENHHQLNSSSSRVVEKSFSTTGDDSSGFSSNCTSSLMQQNPSHRGLHRFMSRHKDEISIEVGDPIYVEYEAEDHWCYGTNLRTGQNGIFPSVNVFEMNFETVESILNAGLLFCEKDAFYVTYLASVEVAYHKGNEVLVQAIHKVLQTYQKKDDVVRPAPVLLDISFRGIHIIQKTKNNWFSCPNFDYFYGLQNISFCGAHPKQLKYFGFITKHPLLPRFACHVFMSNTSTVPVVEAIGRAFQQSYNEYMAFAHPTEDIYME